MTNVFVPPGETLRRAVRWFAEERAARPTESIARLVEETSIRFDLSPAQEAWLLEFARPLAARSGEASDPTTDEP